ncbi:MAG: RbsD/FucU domain-containing protein [Paracoccaceae bacterium]
MLKGIDSRMTAELLDTLMRMGHGDELVLADRNYPSHSNAAATVTGRVVELPGFSAPEAIALICSVMPLDAFVPAGALWMQADGQGDRPELVHDDALAVIGENLPKAAAPPRSSGRISMPTPAQPSPSCAAPKTAPMAASSSAKA